jgi:Cu(I)/Ag(I) efflux system membrane protein CusA/SilA
VKVFGNDLATIEQKATEIERALRPVPGVADLYAERITGAPYLEIKVNREPRPATESTLAMYRM